MVHNIFQTLKEIFRYRNQKEPTERYSLLKTNSMYVINVCALYLLSDKKVLLTGSEKKLLTETRKFKYRPIIILEQKNKQVKFISLSLYRNLQGRKNVIFDHKKCKFITVDCFLKKEEKDIRNTTSAIFYKRIIRNKDKYIKKAIFELPISVFKDLKDFEDAKDKHEVMKICNLNENYKLIKRCASCDEKYIKNLLLRIY